MTSKDLRSALRAGWWMPLVGLVTGAAAAVAFSLLVTPQYSSHAQLFISTASSASTSETFQASQFSQQRVASYVELLDGEELAGRVIDRLDLQLTPRQVIERVEATSMSGTVLLDVTVTDTSAREAQRIADAIATEFPLLINELETTGDGASPVRVTVVDQPDVPEEASFPRTRQNVALGGLAGLLLGLAFAILRRLLDRTIKEPDEATQLAGAPVIGAVIQDPALAKQHLVGRNSSSRSAEDYRQLRTNLQYLNVDEPAKVIMVTSPLPSEGKTTAVVNLAVVLADAGRRVTVVEADLRKPKVTRYLGLVGGVGLTNVLSGSAEVEDVLQKYGSGDLYVIAAGPKPPNPGELLSSSQMFSLLDKLRSENDFVLVDAPPLLPVADSTGLSVYMDGVLLSVRYGSTRKEQLQRAAATLDQVGAKTLGIILNIVPPTAELGTAYGYRFGYA